MATGRDVRKYHSYQITTVRLISVQVPNCDSVGGRTYSINQHIAKTRECSTTNQKLKNINIILLVTTVSATGQDEGTFKSCYALDMNA